MAHYTIGAKDIIDISNHLGVLLTKEQVAKAVDLYLPTKAKQPSKAWYEIIEISINKVLFKL